MDVMLDMQGYQSLCKQTQIYLNTMHTGYMCDLWHTSVIELYVP